MNVPSMCKVITLFCRLQPYNFSSVVDYFEEATMMFVNITNLSELTASLYRNLQRERIFVLILKRDPGDTFNIFNEIFTQFDEATRSFHLEKIKTV